MPVKTVLLDLTLTTTVDETFLKPSGQSFLCNAKRREIVGGSVVKMLHSSWIRRGLIQMKQNKQAGFRAAP